VISFVSETNSSPIIKVSYVSGLNVVVIVWSSLSSPGKLAPEVPKKSIDWNPNPVWKTFPCRVRSTLAMS
jgi:hypothetical protein